LQSDVQEVGTHLVRDGRISTSSLGVLKGATDRPRKMTVSDFSLADDSGNDWVGVLQPRH
jgi:hypothetical protein